MRCEKRGGKGGTPAGLGLSAICHAGLFQVRMLLLALLVKNDQDSRLEASPRPPCARGRTLPSTFAANELAAEVPATCAWYSGRNGDFTQN